MIGPLSSNVYMMSMRSTKMWRERKFGTEGNKTDEQRAKLDAENARKQLLREAQKKIKLDEKCHLMYASVEKSLTEYNKFEHNLDNHLLVAATLTPLVQYIIEPSTLDRGRKESIGMYRSRAKMVTRLRSVNKRQNGVDLIVRYLRRN